MAGEHPNYHQLLYFWAVVREGGVAKAAEALHVTPQTISGQLKLLQASINGRLLSRVGRRLEPTDLGRAVFRLAEDIFARGLELAEFIRAGTPRAAVPLLVGIADALPASMVCAALAPAQGTRLTCREGTLEVLLSDLGAHRLDLVLAASALPSSSPLKGSSYLLSESDVVFFATGAVARSLKGRFPHNLDRAPWLLPLPGSAIRRVLDAWFGRHGIVPSIVAELDSSALLHAMAAQGAGVTCAPAEIEKELVARHGLGVIGRARDVRARLYAIALERRVQLPAVAAILGRPTVTNGGTPGVLRGSATQRSAAADGGRDPEYA